MTVQYYQNVLSGGPLVFFKLLFRWRGGILKLIYMDITIFVALYTLISVLYRYAMEDEHQRFFERVVIFVRESQQMIPISFVLGFYVSQVFKRFWTIFIAIPWLVRFGCTLTAHLREQSKQAAIVRETIVRYLNASLIIAFSRLHVVAKKRFPTFDCLVELGIMKKEEIQVIEAMKDTSAQPFMPIVWAVQLLTYAERHKLIRNPFGYVTLVKQVDLFREGLLKIFLMDQVCIPLVYTQVVTLAVYCYFCSCLIGRQFIVSESPMYDDKRPDMVFPLYTIFEFVIYMSWMKVAETLVNPMGEDDEDLDINEIIDFNIGATTHMAGMTDSKAPELVQDLYWGTKDIKMPHTDASGRLRAHPFLGSTFDVASQSADQHSKLSVVAGDDGGTQRRKRGFFSRGGGLEENAIQLLREGHNALIRSRKESMNEPDEVELRENARDVSPAGKPDSALERADPPLSTQGTRENFHSLLHQPIQELDENTDIDELRTKKAPGPDTNSPNA